MQYFRTNRGEKVPLKPVSSQTAALGIHREANPCEVANHTNKLLGGGLQGSNVVERSPMCWNFFMWHGGKAVYYGLTKAEWPYSFSSHHGSWEALRRQQADTVPLRFVFISL